MRVDESGNKVRGTRPEKRNLAFNVLQAVFALRQVDDFYCNILIRQNVRGSPHFAERALPKSLMKRVSFLERLRARLGRARRIPAKRPRHQV